MLYALFPGDHGWSTDEYAHREETDALEACLSSAVTSLRVPELDDGATRMRNLCARVCAMANATTAAKLMARLGVASESTGARIGGP